MALEGQCEDLLWPLPPQQSHHSGGHPPLTRSITRTRTSTLPWQVQTPDLPCWGQPEATVTKEEGEENDEGLGTSRAPTGPTLDAPGKRWCRRDALAAARGSCERLRSSAGSGGIRRQESSGRGAAPGPGPHRAQCRALVLGRSRLEPEPQQQPCQQPGLGLLFCFSSPAERGPFAPRESTGPAQHPPVPSSPTQTQPRTSSSLGERRHCPIIRAFLKPTHFAGARVPILTKLEGKPLWKGCVCLSPFPTGCEEVGSSSFLPQSSASEKMLGRKDLHAEDQKAALRVGCNSPHSILCSAPAHYPARAHWKG